MLYIAPGFFFPLFLWRCSPNRE